ncbi:MAG: glycoside hydrolase family 66 protein, partial [Balneolaceae bacterium]
MVQPPRHIAAILFSMLVLSACGSTAPEDKGGNEEMPPSSDEPLKITTDKAAYSPGETVVLTISRRASSQVMVRYKYLNKVIRQSSVSGTSWQWTPPDDDFKGYVAEVYRDENGSEKILATIGIDVSSGWTKFPRYGFLSDYGNLDDSEMAAVIENLNRHHINGIQFYDWQYKHHQMLAGTPDSPQPVWKNIANDDVYFSTVESYIKAAHEHNMSTMFYNLVYGALENASADGVSEKWYLYTDQSHTNKDRHSLPSPPFKSDIFLLDSSNAEWQQFLADENQKVYSALDFDGFHMDQLGDRGSRYAYNGDRVNLAQTFRPFIESMEQANPDKYLVMNAVNQYGQPGISDAPTDFLYTEVWSPNEAYKDLARVITDNNRFGNDLKNSVLAAYVNYNMADSKGYFNTPSVIFTDAVIFAFGGSHLELGEHMLGKEYFPNSNLSMRKDLKEALVSYYDFLVGYENLLRGGGAYNTPDVSTYGEVTLNQWPPQQGKVSVVGKAVGKREVI